MTKLVAISGSLRKASFNTALLRAALDMAPDGVGIVEGSIHGIPLYDGDAEAADGIPEAVTRLKDLVADADGVILFTPEYNNGIPGVFKNAIDWLSRPSSDIARVFGDRPFAVIGASPGGFGTILAQNGWLPVLKTLGTQQWSGARLQVSRAGKVFDEQGELVDEAVRVQLGNFLRGFASHIDRHRPG